MSSDNDGFQERLRRIQAKQNAHAQIKLEPVQPKAPPPPEPDEEYVYTGRPAARSATPVLAVVGILAVMGAGAAVYFRDIAPKEGGTLIASLGEVPVSAVENTAVTETAAAIAGEEPSATKAPNWLQRWIGGPLDPVGDVNQNPIAYLPPAPDGWVRVTTDDAKAPDALASISARWSQTMGDGMPLERNLGYKHLEHFLKIYATEDMEGQILAQRSTRAMYMNGRGEFMNVQLEFLPDARKLGEPGATGAWLNALAEVETKEKTAMEVVERDTIDGVALTNRTLPPGASLMARPIAQNRDAPGGFKIAVPLSHRAVIRFHGVFVPRDAAALVQAMDRDAVIARHD